MLWNHSPMAPTPGANKRFSTAEAIKKMAGSWTRCRTAANSPSSAPGEGPPPGNGEGGWSGGNDEGSKLMVLSRRGLGAARSAVAGFAVLYGRGGGKRRGPGGAGLGKAAGAGLGGCAVSGEGEEGGGGGAAV